MDGEGCIKKNEIKCLAWGWMISYSYLKQKFTLQNFYLLIILIVPLAMYYDSDYEYLFYSYGGLDAYYYIAYFHEYFTGLNPGLIQYYKIGRLAWIIPGAVIYNLFNYKVAHTVLTLGTLYLTYYSLYYLVRKIFEPLTAILTVILLMFYVHSYGIGQWNYHTNIAIVYLLIAMIFFLKAATKNRSEKYAFYSGIFYFGAVTMLPFILLFSPMFIILYLLNCSEVKWADLFRKGFFFILGMITILILLQIAHSLLGYDNFFLGPLIDLITLLKKNDPWYTQFKDAYSYPFLFLTYTVLGICILLSTYLLRKRVIFKTKKILFCQFCFFAGVIAFAYMYVNKKQILTGYFFLSIIPFLFLAMASTFYCFCSSIKPSSRIRFILPFILISLSYFGFYISPFEKIIILLQYQLPGFWVYIWVSSFVILSTITLLIFFHKKTLSLIIVILSFHALYTIVSPKPHPITRRQYSISNKSAYYSMFKVRHILYQLYPMSSYHSSYTYVGFSKKGKSIDGIHYTNLFHSTFSSLLSFSFRDITPRKSKHEKKFPFIDKDVYIPSSDFKLIVFRINDTDTKNIVDSLSKLGRVTQILNRFLIQEGNVQYYMDILQVGTYDVK